MCPPRVLEEMFLANGARIGYWRGSIEGVIDDLQVSCLHHATSSPADLHRRLPLELAW